MTNKNLMSDEKESVTLTEAMALKNGKASTIDSITKLYFYNENLNDISIIEKMSNLEIAYFSSNHITTFKNFSKLPKLRELYIRSNKIETFEELKYLKELKNLRILWMLNNPVSELQSYREIVIKLLPQLSKLDDVEISDAERRFVALASPQITSPQPAATQAPPEPPQETNQTQEQQPPNPQQNQNPNPTPSPQEPEKVQQKEPEKVQQKDPEKVQQKEPEKPLDKLPPLEKITQPQQPKKPVPTSFSPMKKPLLASLNKSKALPPVSTITVPPLEPLKEDDQNLLSAVLTLLPELSMESLEIVVHKIRELTK